LAQPLEFPLERLTDKPAQLAFTYGCPQFIQQVFMDLKVCLLQSRFYGLTFLGLVVSP
jgi:hypothetical protein